ncbi:YqzM family protein [Aneurinibacillus tyrosinisolvens]|nr:YqzM family protein [Aneurinibacillus tyrosinisolvens]
MANPNINLDKEQNDVIDSSVGFGASFGILMLIFIAFTVIEYFKQ